MKQHVLENTFTTLGYSKLEMSEAVERLHEEHEELREELHDLHVWVKAVSETSGAINRTGILSNLRETADQFKRQLDAHAKWEEERLFPMVAWYYGEELGQFTLMEQEHVLAEQFIQAFVDALERAPVRRHEEKEMVSYLTQAILILNQHFQMEEELIATLIDRSDSYGY
ncbi:hemerythrin domain-containing protein [Cohnella cholangitidis]|nr:hemerythrin domain-containing protein [Cohnella cholangitidis]